VARYRAGRLLEEETVDDKGQPMTRKHVDDRVEVSRRFTNGQLYRTYVTVKGDYDGEFKEWTQEGKLVEESRYAKANLTARKRYYLNGRVKQELAVDPRSGLITVREFYDTGQPKQTGTYQGAAPTAASSTPPPTAPCASMARTGASSVRPSTPPESWTASAALCIGTERRRSRRPMSRGESGS
jgi:hypothetical protein